MYVTAKTIRTTIQATIPMKIKDKFTELKSRNEGALIAYICAGDPTPEATAEIVHALSNSGSRSRTRSLMVRRFRRQSNVRSTLA